MFSHSYNTVKIFQALSEAALDENGAPILDKSGSPEMEINTWDIAGVFCLNMEMLNEIVCRQNSEFSNVPCGFMLDFRSFCILWDEFDRRNPGRIASLLEEFPGWDSTELHDWIRESPHVIYGLHKSDAAYGKEYNDIAKTAFSHFLRTFRMESEDKAERAAEISKAKCAIGMVLTAALRKGKGAEVVCHLSGPERFSAETSGALSALVALLAHDYDGGIVISLPSELLGEKFQMDLSCLDLSGSVEDNVVGVFESGVEAESLKGDRVVVTTHDLYRQGLFDGRRVKLIDCASTTEKGATTHNS